MRILTLSTSYPRSVDDYAGRFVSDLNLSLRRSGATTTTLCPEVSEISNRQEPSSERVLRVPFGNTTDRKLFYASNFELRPLSRLQTLRAGFRFVRSMRRAVSQEIQDHDAVIVHWPWPLILGCGDALGRRPAVGLCHGADLRWLDRSRLARLVFGLYARPLRGLFTTRSNSVALLKSVYEGPIVGSPMGADGKRYQGRRVSPEMSHQLLYVGRLVREKGLEDLIRVLPRLGWPLLVMGGGPEETRLRQLAASCGAQVTFLGWQGPDAVADALASVRMIVVPSRGETTGGAEGFPTVLCEPALAGTPIQAARVGGIADWIPDGATYEPNSQAALLEALRRRLQEPREATIQDAAPFGSDMVASKVLGLLFPS